MKDEISQLELIVHIGSGKTGSSSIQKTLSANSAVLKENGFAYIGLMGEEALSKQYPWQKASGWPDLLANGMEQAQEELKQMLVQAVTDLSLNGYTHAVWSNETLFGNSGLIIPILKQIEKMGVKVKIIVYIRRHDAWIRSAYMQWGIKHKTYQGPVKSFAEWSKENLPSFFSGLKPWLDTQWADIAVRNFDSCGDVVADFLKYYDLQNENVVFRRDNETPNPTALALWAIYNSQFKEKILPGQLQRLLKQTGLLENAPLPCTFRDLLPIQEDVDAIREVVAEDRSRVNEIFSSFSQPEMDVSELSLKDMTVSQDHLNAAFLLMLKHQNDQINALSKKLADLEVSRTDDTG
jgi:hypothetical protein